VKKTVSLERHIAKTVTYRILGTGVTVLSALAFGANIEVASLLGVGELIFKPLLYFIHERLWYKSNYGIK
jgi:uncharacterized membrane protein